MNRSFSKHVVLLGTLVLCSQILWSTWWYFSHSGGQKRIQKLLHDIEDQRASFNELKHYHETRNTIQQRWHTSNQLHEALTRNTLNYSYPYELIFLFPSDT